MQDQALAPLLAGGIPAALGLVFVGVGLALSRRSRHWTPTEGVVVDRRSGRADRGMTALYPTFQWRDANGEVHQHTSSVRQSLGPSPGTVVPVRYDPDRPDRAMIDTYVQGGRIFLHIGVALLAAAVLALTVVTTIVTT